MADTVVDKIQKALIDSGLLTQKDLDRAKLLQKKKKISLDRILINEGLVQEEELLGLLVRELNIPFLNLSKYRIDPALQEMVPEKVARQYNIIPLSVLEGALTVAVSDPLNVFLVDDLKNITGLQIDVVMGLRADILKAIDSFYGDSSVVSVSDFSKDIEFDDFEIIMQKDEDTSDGDSDEGEKAPIIRMVNLVIKEALKRRASDIHLEPMADGLRVRYRVDGILHDILTIPKENQNSILIRLKIMARLDITSNQIPQDGRFKMKILGQEVDFRVSSLPTTFGQKVVMRILDKKNLAVGLDGLGLSPKAYAILNEGIRKPFGMIIVTGPTGSGKSTTLYSIISELNTIDKNIVTVEDPVEYLIEGLTQIQAHEDIGLTFAAGLRAILRQSPDIVMIGEIRDTETADIAIKASLTGQLVLSTLHTNDATGALTRLVDMGVEPFLVASSIVLVTAQRLCRKICEQCKEEIEVHSELFKSMMTHEDLNMTLYHGRGCEACHQTGYLGRMSITEVLEVDDAVRELLLQGKSSDEIKAFAQKNQGMQTLWHDAMDKCQQGLITFEEVLRVSSKD